MFYCTTGANARREAPKTSCSPCKMSNGNLPLIFESPIATWEVRSPVEKMSHRIYQRAYSLNTRTLTAGSLLRGAGYHKL